MGFRLTVGITSCIGILSGCNKMPVTYGDSTQGEEDATTDHTAGAPPTAITGTNFVDLKTGSLGLEVDFKPDLVATISIKWFVKKDSAIPNALLDYVEADGFAEHIALDGAYLIKMNGEDITSRCVVSPGKNSAVCENLKVKSPAIEASVTGALLNLKSKDHRGFEAHAPYVSQISPGSLLAAGGKVSLDGHGFAAQGLEVNLLQGLDKKVLCMTPDIKSDQALTCDQPEVFNLSGPVDLKVMAAGQSFIYRSAYRVIGQDLFLNTNCDQAVAAISAPGLTNAWSAPAFDLGPTSAGSATGSAPTRPVTVNGLSTYALNHVDQGVIRGGETVAQWCIANVAGGKNSGVMTVGPDGSYNQVIPLFCGKQLVYILPKAGMKTAIGVYEITRANCTTSELMVTLAWGADGSDMELHLIRAGGVLNNLDGKSNDCMWSSCLAGSPDWGVLGDPTDNPKKDIDWREINGTENISLPKPEKTSYDMYVEYWGTGTGDAPSDLRVTVNALGTADTIALSDVAIDKGGVATKGNLLAYRWVWWVGRVSFTGVSPSIQFNRKVAEALKPSVLFDCNTNWSGGCNRAITPSTLPMPVSTP